MPRLSTVLALSISLAGYFLPTTVAGPTGTGSTGVTASSTRRIPAGTASSSGRASTRIVTSSRRSASVTATATTSSSSGYHGDDDGDDDDDDDLDENGCRPISTTTSTITTTTCMLASDTPTTTYTFTSFAYASSATSVITTISTSYTYEFTSTISSTNTYTVTSTTVNPASTTITVPTPAGFTPVLCLSAWRNPRITTTATAYYTSTSVAYVTVTSSNTAPTTVTTYVFPSTSTSVFRTDTYDYSYTEVSTVTTIDRPTSTVYEACATNNVVGESPSGKNFSIPQIVSGVSFRGVDAYNPIDCCERCQADPTCVSTSGGYTNGNGSGRYSCIFNVLSSSNNATTCDPTFKAADILSSDASLFFQIFISNSGCGQFF